MNKMLALAVAGLLLCSCKMLDLGRNITEAKQAGGVAGKVVHREGDGTNIVVFALRETGEGPVAENYASLASADSFLLRLEAGQRYVVGAFSDRNGNLTPDSDEPATLAPQPFTVAQGWKGLTRISLDLRPQDRLPRAALAALAALAKVDRKPLPIAVGEVASLDDERFSEESGAMGLWAPLDFLTHVGIGVFFAEPYDPKRIPVLFVSGAGGNPHEWRAIVDSLDHKRYQAWFYVYPSGQRLALSAAMLQRCIEELQRVHGFKRLYITAHSMGGLVARGYLQNALHAGDAAYLPLFVSMSTPWRGHTAAKLGVDHSPAVIPSWIDMQTDSDYQQAIFSRPLASPMHYYLLYSQTDPKAPAATATDGAVSVSSQLRHEAVRDARQVLGFTETHTSILSSSTVIAAYTRILNELDR